MREGHPNRTNALHPTCHKWGNLCACDRAWVAQGDRCKICGRRQPILEDKKPRPDIDLEEATK